MSALRVYKRLREAGVDEATAMLCAEEFEQELKLAVDAILEPKRAKDRARKAAKAPRNSAESTETPESAEVAEFHDTPPSPALSPQTPQTHPHPPGDISTRARVAVAKPNGFARFWEAYPNKVGKAAAEKAYARALKAISGPDPPSLILAGVERAKASRQWGEGYIPHPTTWLNRGSWDDQPAEIIHMPTRTHDRPHDDKLTRKQANLSRAFAASERASGFRGEP